ncbi:hypothetical protein UNSWDHB_1364 [Dehalobacter sp. UNSWDHB]|nr:hypothetical protein UNSWDHB_1364 [Dehalobacter sp. UNSWDHB]
MGEFPSSGEKEKNKVNTFKRLRFYFMSLYYLYKLTYIIHNRIMY